MKTSRTTDGQRGQEGPGKNPARKKVFAKYMQEKLAVTVLVIMLALFALVMVLYKIVDENNEDYTRVVLSQRSTYDSRTIPYRRGDIVDRNGTYLATRYWTRARSTRRKSTIWTPRSTPWRRYSATAATSFWKP